RVLEAADTSLRTSPVGSFVGGLLTCLGYFVFVVVATLLTILLAIIFVVVLLGPLAAFSILGGILAVGVVSYLFLLAVLYLADVVVALGLAHVVSRPGPDESRWREQLLLVIGAVVVVVLTALPVVGGLAKLLVVLFGLGALAYAWWQSRKKGDIGPASGSAEPPPAPAPPAAG